MSEDWASIATEVSDAIKSIGSTDAGYPVALRKEGADAPAVPGGPPTGSVTYSTLYAVVSDKELRDINGTLIGMTKRTLMVNATGAVPEKGDQVAMGIDADAADDDSEWLEIAEVRPLSPAGTAVLYELDLVT